PALRSHRSALRSHSRQPSPQPSLSSLPSTRTGRFPGGLGLAGGLGAPWCTKVTPKPESTPEQFSVDVVACDARCHSDANEHRTAAAARAADVATMITKS